MNDDLKTKSWTDKDGKLWFYASGKFDGKKLLDNIKKLFTSKNN